MKFIVRIVFAGLLTLLPAANLTSAAKDPPWQTGRVGTISISSQRLNAKRASSDLWWTYSICAAKQNYIAVTRDRPEKVGLTESGNIRFYFQSNRIYYLDAQGKRQFMRIIRKSTGCLKRD